MDSMEIRTIGKIPTLEALKAALQDRILPVKFCYPEEGGDLWNELVGDEEYTLAKREWAAFTKGLLKVKTAIGDAETNIVHLGPGNGREIPPLFDILKPIGTAIYAGVDISTRMIENTYRLKESYFSHVDTYWILTDIESEGNLESVDDYVRIRGATRSLFLLNNQGVLLSNPETLENIRAAMRSQDYLFITVEGDEPDKRAEICASYDLPETRSLLSVGLQRAGYNPGKGKFRTVFNEEKSVAEVYFTPDGEADILCLTSYKPKEDGFRRRLDELGFVIEFMEFYNEEHTFAVLCSKKEV